MEAASNNLDPTEDNSLLENTKNQPRIIKVENQNHKLISDREDESTFDSLLKENSNETTSNKPKWTSLLILTSFISAMGIAVPSGYSMSVMNNPALHIQYWCNQTIVDRFDIYMSAEALDLVWSVVVSIFLIGGGIGALSGAGVANNFGRKKSILTCGILLLFGGACFYGCRILNSIELLILGRFVVGLANGLIAVCLPMYLIELSPMKFRGVLGVCCTIGLTTGVLIGQILSLNDIFGSEQFWHIALSCYTVLVILYLIPYHYYPESPKWLFAIKGDKLLAEAQLRKLRSINEKHLIEKELENMKLEENLSKQSTSFWEVLTDAKLRLPLILLCTFHGGQQLSGINVILNYSVLIFVKAGFSSKAAEWANLELGALCFVVILICPYLMTRFGRRPMMLISSFCAFIALITFGVLLYYIDSADWLGITCIVAVSAYLFFNQIGLGPISYFIGSELFEVAPRSVAMSMGILTNFAGSFISCITFPSLQNAMGPLVFIPLSLNLIVIFIMTYLYLPETKGRDAVEIARIVSKGFKSKVRN